jgi:hypothetical protein
MPAIAPMGRSYKVNPVSDVGRITRNGLSADNLKADNAGALCALRSCGFRRCLYTPALPADRGRGPLLQGGAALSGSRQTVGRITRNGLCAGYFDGAQVGGGETSGMDFTQGLSP